MKTLILKGKKLKRYWTIERPPMFRDRQNSYCETTQMTESDLQSQTRFISVPMTFLTETRKTIPGSTREHERPCIAKEIRNKSTMPEVLKMLTSRIACCFWSFKVTHGLSGSGTYHIAQARLYNPPAGVYHHVFFQ